jgi:NTP pyrophosphatase (non-canonical NTP hydrolase)
MNDPITILTAALLHAQGRFLFYAQNHTDKAANLQRQLDETPAGLDPDTVAHLQAQIADTLAKAEANRDEVRNIGLAIRQATGLDATYVRVVPLNLIGAALHCVAAVAPGGQVQRQLREIAHGDRAEGVRLPDGFFDAGVFDLIVGWAAAKDLVGIERAFPQMVKLTEEVGEVAHAVARKDLVLLKDGIGDVGVVLTILAAQHDLTIQECIMSAWDVIKGRTGKTVDGVFIKDEAS